MRDTMVLLLVFSVPLCDARLEVVQVIVEELEFAFVHRPTLRVVVFHIQDSILDPDLLHFFVSIVSFRDFFEQI